MLVLYSQTAYICSILTMITGGKYRKNAQDGIIKTVKHESN